MFRWLAGRGAPRRKVVRQLAEITAGVWRQTVQAHPFLNGLSAQENEDLRERTAWLLASKTFSGVRGLDMTDEIMLSIAVQAALPILNLDPVLYEGWTEIVVYPGGFLIPRTDVDAGGVVHEYLQPASGEAWDGGPVVLSWEDAGPGTSRKSNVVIHEFAHKLDLQAGGTSGMPSLAIHPIKPEDWRRVFRTAFRQFRRSLASVENAIPRDVDPESDTAAPWYGSLPLDPYAAANSAEFFAVSTETFFVNPEPLSKGLPEWYGMLAAYYKQDPLRRLRRVE